MVGERDTNKIGERTPEVRTAVRPESERGAGRNRDTCVGQPAATRRAISAACLERNDDPLAESQVSHRVAEVDNLAHHLVTHRERWGDRVEPERDDRVEIAAGNGQWAYQCVAWTTQLRIRALLPRQISRTAENQMSHASTSDQCQIAQHRHRLLDQVQFASGRRHHPDRVIGVRGDPQGVE
jgi:hypothetical protein